MAGQLSEVITLLNTLCKDPSISKNVRAVLEAILDELKNSEGDLGVKINAALQKIEDVSLDPNLSMYVRAQIWNLTSMLEAVNSNIK